METTEREKYYYAGAVRLAMREDSDDPLYLIGDHLGSTSLVLDTARQEVAKQSYLPFGETWGVSATDLPTDYTFTGQREAAEIGLMYYVARWYDSEIGHFVQADTIVPGAGNPLAWNRYAYVNYNPLKYTDPSGHDSNPPIPLEELVTFLHATKERYFEFPNKAVADWDHLNLGAAYDLLNSLNNGVSLISISQTSMGYTYTLTYQIDYSKDISLASLGAGIWLDYQQNFERWQTALYALDFTGTGQSPEDVPSTYLAYLAVANNLWKRGDPKQKAIDSIVNIYGGGTPLNAKPSYLSTFISVSPYFQIPNSSGGISSLPYPETIYIAPLGNDGYWAVVDEQQIPDRGSPTYWMNETLWVLRHSFGPDSIIQ